ncbi:MAG: hypothetical protein NVS9B10_16930 [Nevskia sp.]
MDVFVDAVGLAAAGLPDWASAVPVLLGRAPYVAAELPPYAPQLLPPNERRRATASIRQAFRAAEDALADGAAQADRLAAVFASSDADLAIIQRISLALTEPARAVSPTDFHNSVHNAAAGYWSIATGSRLPSTTICAYDASFAAGLLEAASFVAIDGLDTLLVCYDVPGPALLQAQRPFDCAASTALRLRAQAGPRTLARLRLSVGPAAETVFADAALEALRLGNPALRALPLLRLLAAPATEAAASVVLALPGAIALRLERLAP